MTNEALIALLVSKGIIATGDLGTGGKLNDAQSDRFIDFVIDETGLNTMGRVVRFRNENLNIDKIGVHSRVTVPAEEARDPAVRRGVNTSQVVLTPCELMTPFEISTNFMEHNIEGESVEDTVVRLMATQMGNDVEGLYIEGDTLGRAALESDLFEGGDTTRYIKDSLMAKLNGFLRQADSANLVDVDGAAISPNVFSQMLQSMPNKFRRNRRDLVFLVPDDLEQQYRERVSTRATGAGDAALNGQANLRPFGVELMPVSLWPMNTPVVEHITFTGSGSTVALRYNNLVSGSDVVTDITLDKVPTTPYVGAGTDYTFDATAGTITHGGGGSAIGATATVKITYDAGPQIILTPRSNLIFAIGRDITIERDRDIFARLNQWAITTKVDVKFEEISAVVKAYNVASAL
jgi:hypothetical protein